MPRRPPPKTEITKPAIRMLCRRGGVKRIRSDVYAKVRLAIRGIRSATLRHAATYADSRKSSMVTSRDVALALQRQNRTLYSAATTVGPMLVKQVKARRRPQAPAAPPAPLAPVPQPLPVPAAPPEPVAPVPQPLPVPAQPPWTTAPRNWAVTPQMVQMFQAALVGPDTQVKATYPPGQQLIWRQVMNMMVKDMKSLCQREWLNDEVINTYMTMLQDRDTQLRGQAGVPRCHFFSSFFLNKLYKDSGRFDYSKVKRWTVPRRLRSHGQASDSILDLDMIIMPVHQGIHWTTAAIDLKHHRFLYFDSFLGEDDACVDYLKKYLKEEYRDKRNIEVNLDQWETIYPKDIPRQHNGCDCGVFTVMYANRLGLGRGFDFQTQDMVRDMRIRIGGDLLHQTG